MSIDAYDYGKKDGFDEAIQAVIKFLENADSVCGMWAAALVEDEFTDAKDV